MKANDPYYFEKLMFTIFTFIIIAGAILLAMEGFGL